MDTHIDIIAAPQYKSFEELEQNNVKLSKVWLSKFSKEEYIEKAGFEPEFGKIIGLGVTSYTRGVMEIKTKVTEEKAMLESFAEMCNHVIYKWHHNLVLVGCGIKSFDLSFLLRRYILTNTNMPKILQQLTSKKPYELGSFVTDISEMYGNSPQSKFGKNIDAISASLGLESESEYLGSDMVQLYLDGKLDEIEKYLRSNIKNIMEIKKIIHENMNFNWHLFYEEQKEGKVKNG